MKKENIIISVGRLEKQKDFTTLIKAYKKVKVKYPEWVLKIYGQGNCKEELNNLIIKEKLSDVVQLCGVTHTPFLEMNAQEFLYYLLFMKDFQMYCVKQCMRDCLVFLQDVNVDHLN